MPTVKEHSADFGNYMVVYEVKHFSQGEYVPQHMREAKQNPVDPTIKPGESQFVTGITAIYINMATSGKPRWVDAAEVDPAELAAKVEKYELELPELKAEVEQAKIEARNLKSANTKFKRRLSA